MLIDKGNVNIKSYILRNLCRLLLIMYSITVIYPLIWNLCNSFKTSREFYQDPFGLPKALHWENYITAIRAARIDIYLLNSIITTVCVWAISILIGSMAAYIFARYAREIRAIKVLYRITISMLFVPTMFFLVPIFLLLNKVNLTNSMIGYIITMSGAQLLFIIFTLTGFFTSIPREYEEAAAIDGYSHYGIFFKIILPLAKSGIAAISIFVSMWQFNEYLYAITLLSDQKKFTLPVGLVYLMEVQQYRTDWGALFAGLVIAIIPTLALYLVFNNKITSGISLGGLKG